MSYPIPVHISTMCCVNLYWHFTVDWFPSYITNVRLKGERCDIYFLPA